MYSWLRPAEQLVWPVCFLCLMMTAVKCLRRLLCVMTFILTVFRGCKAQTDCECSPQMSFTMWSLIPVNTLSRGQCCWLSRTLVALSCGRPPCGPEQAPIARSKWTCKIAPMEETWARICCNDKVFLSLQRRCPGGRCLLNHKAWGRSSSGGWATADETAYPQGLARAIAKCFFSAVEHWKTSHSRILLCLKFGPEPGRSPRPPDQSLKYSNICYYDPATKGPVLRCMYALPFGASRAVYGYLRIAHSLWWLAVKCLSLMMTHFFDDFITVCRKGEAALVSQVLGNFFRLLGCRLPSLHCTFDLMYLPQVTDGEVCRSASAICE